MNDWTWGGYFGANYKADRNKLTSSFDPFVLSINTTMRQDEKLAVRAQIDYEHGPFFNTSADAAGAKSLDSRGGGEIVLSNAYAEYVVAEWLKLRAGKFFAPIGYYNQLFYAVPSYAALGIPSVSVYSRSSTPSGDARYFQRYAMGAWAAGAYQPGETELSYDLYVSNGRAHTPHEDQNNHKAVGGRAKAVILAGPVKVTPILSGYFDKYNTSALNTPVWKSQRSVLPGVELEAGDFTLRGEYAYTDVKLNTGKYDVVSDAFYTEASYTFKEKVTPFVRFEHIDPDRKTRSDRELESTFGAAYHLKLWQALLKAQVRMHNFEDPNKSPYNIYEAGVALAF